MIRIILLVLILMPHCSIAASFNCQYATHELDKSICSNEKLSRLDERMANYYFKLKETLPDNLTNDLIKQQRKWLKQRTKICGLQDSICLIKLYQSRTLDLRKEYENLVPYTVLNSRELQGVRGDCSLKKENLPDDLLIYAGGSYSGRKINHQIDQGGHQATQFEVVVNSPEHPVALILGAYEPSIWNIAWSQGTQIKAVVVTGYNRQVVAGLPKDTPILNSSYHNHGSCGYFYITEKTLRKINPLSNRVFGKNVTLVSYASKGTLVFGDQITQKNKLFTSSVNPPEAFFYKSKPLSGKAGLDDLVAKGFIRRSASEDINRWAKKKADAYKEELPPTDSGSRTATFRPRYVHNGYVILKKITIPAGLYGGDLATFFLNEGVPYPDGNLGHSTLYDFGTLTCHGTGCRR